MIDGNGDEEFLPYIDAADPEWQESEKNRNFRLALERALREFPAKLEQPPEPRRIAACKQAPSAKKTHKPKGGDA